MKERYCSKCRKLLPLSNFKKQKSKYSEYYRSDCKKCYDNYIKNYYRTKEGLIKKIYLSQIQSSKKRKHPHPEYTLKELRNFILLHPDYEILYNNWIKSNYNKLSKPSIDRISSKLHYTLNNIQLTTWDINNQNGYNERRKNKKIIKQKYILQFDKDGFFIKSFISLKDVFSKTCINTHNISKVYNGKKESIGGYKWECVVIEETVYPYKDFNIYFKSDVTN